MDPTIILYLLDPEGQFVDYYGQTKDAKMIGSSVMLHMGKWLSEKKRSESLLAKITG